MKRKEIMWIGITFFVILVLDLIVVALMPLWFPVIMVKPSWCDRIRQKFVQRTTRQMVKGMMKA